jgi:SNF2 family DNA or RNA helicase
MDAPSGKLRLLMEEVLQVTSSGHKCLVFSQFTSFLKIVQSALSQEGVATAWLDGSTSDRSKPVKQFQEDPECRVFLISLKAGGVGLNLVAADYVFIIDPWWNPAAEAQAADRAHRIGQTRQVFVYRLVSADTVEERVLHLQDQKRELAAQFLETGNRTTQLTAEDLRFLLGNEGES